MEQILTQTEIPSEAYTPVAGEKRVETRFIHNEWLIHLTKANRRQQVQFLEGYEFGGAARVRNCGREMIVKQESLFKSAREVNTFLEQRAYNKLLQDKAPLIRCWNSGKRDLKEIAMELGIKASGLHLQVKMLKKMGAIGE